MVFNNNLLLGAAGQGGGVAPFDPTLIGNSVWLDGPSDYFSKTYAGSGNSTTEGIFSFWYQRYNFGVAQSTWFEASGFGGLQTNTSYGGGDTLVVNSFTSGGVQLIARHTRLLRDVAWYHIIVSIDMSQVNTLDKIKFYINGEQDTTINVQNLATTNGLDMLGARSKVNFRIGENAGSTGHAYAQYCYLDGVSFQQGDYVVTDFLDTYTFGTNGSQYIPKTDADISALATATGGNSFCLDFSNSADLGNDISSNNNDFTANSMSSDNQSTSTPSNVHSKFNSLDHSTAATITLSNGNRKLAMTTANWKHARTSLPFPDESYCEVVLDARSLAGRMNVGLATGSYNVYSTSPPNTNDSAKRCFYRDDGLFYDFSDTSGTSYTSASLTDVLQVYRKGSNFYIGINGTWVNSADPDADTNPISSSIPSENVFLFVGGYSGETYTLRTEASEWTASNRPASAKAVNTANQTAPDYQGIDYFDATLYEGNGTGQRVGDFVPFTDAYTVDKSAMFENADKRYLSFTPSAGGDQKTFTFSTWFKLSNPNIRNAFLSTDDGSKQAQILHVGDSGKHLNVNFYNGSSFVCNLNTSRLFADTSQWYHLVVAVDTRAAVASANKVKIYINGVQETTTGTALSTDDYETEFNSENAHNIGRQTNNGIGEPSWYLAETVMIDGQQLDASSFGQLDTSTNRWIPKDVSGLTFGDEGWYLEYEGTFNSGVAATGAGKDSSGNGNHWAEQNDSGSAWSTSDQFTDTPSKNFNVFDSGLNAMGTLSEGNTKIVTATNNKAAYTTMNIPSTGKWYWEVDITSYATGGGSYFGLHEYDELNTGSAGVTSTAVIFQNYNGTANVYDSSSTDTTWCNSVSPDSFVSSGDVLQFALDQDAGTLFIGNNNTWFRAGGARDTFANATTVGTAKFPTGIRRRFFVGRGGSFAETYALNFGQQANIFSGSSTTFNAAADGYFVYTPPTGYKALNQDNLDDTSSKITALAWIKNRDAADDNIWMDRVIGTSGYLSTTQNDSGTAATSFGDGGSDVLTTNANVVQRFLQRGVQVGNDEKVNTANESYVLWQWLLGDSATTGSSITTGSPSLATTGVVSDANHFSIVQYTGNGIDNATFAHGLGATPNFVMVKRISGSATNSDWVIHIPGLGTENYIYPHYRIALATGAGANGMVPDANLVEISTGVATNTSGATHMAYSFKNTPGLCKIGTYTGNSSTDGTYVSTGFKPRFIWIFNTTLTSADAERPIFDTARYKFNGATTAGGTNGGINFSDQRAAEEAQNTSLGTNPAIDILSDGFKLRANDSTINTGTTYLYISMADIAGGGTLPPIYGR